MFSSSILSSLPPTVFLDQAGADVLIVVHSDGQVMEILLTMMMMMLLMLMKAVLAVERRPAMEAQLLLWRK